MDVFIKLPVTLKVAQNSSEANCNICGAWIDKGQEYAITTVDKYTTRERTFANCSKCMIKESGN